MDVHPGTCRAFLPLRCVSRSNGRSPFMLI
jgi:hypothetical protein